MLTFDTPSQVVYLPRLGYNNGVVLEPQKSLDTVRKQGCGTLPKLQILRLNLDVGFDAR